MHVKTAFLLGPAEFDRGFSDKIGNTVHEIISDVSLPDLVRILCGAALYLGNDTGVSHLAAACGVRTLVLFGPSDPVIWRPLGDAVKLITSPDGVMESIETDTVYRALVDAGWGVAG
jgi:ADP-heptose:LPS heptosyltransferase